MTKELSNVIILKTIEQFSHIAIYFSAEVAELAYAPVSKTGGGNPMRVQVPPSALFFSHNKPWEEDKEVVVPLLG